MRWRRGRPTTTFIEWGGGYYYPDRFGLNRPNRWELLAKQARRTWAMMKKNNTRMIGFNFANYDSPDARKAYEVFASQTDGLLAIFVFQYSPYEAGAGETFWVKDRNGIELPVITARYSIWEHTQRPQAIGHSCQGRSRDQADGRANAAKKSCLDTIGSSPTCGPISRNRPGPMRTRRTCRKKTRRRKAAYAVIRRPFGAQNVYLPIFVS